MIFNPNTMPATGGGNGFEIVIGTYTGNSSSSQTIDLGKKIAAIIVGRYQEAWISSKENSARYVSVSGSSFTVTGTSSTGGNINGNKYSYVAFLET